MEIKENAGTSVNLLASISNEPTNFNEGESFNSNNNDAPDNCINTKGQHNKNVSGIIIHTSSQEQNYGGRYPTLSKCEVNQLTTYTRISFFRRCKFVNAAVIHGHMKKCFEHMMVFNTNDRFKKTFHVVKCVKDTLSSRRGYATTQICHKLRGTL